MSRNTQKALIQIVFFLFFLYLFFVSIELMSSAFRLMGKKFAENLMSTTANPIVGLFIGIVTTSVVQSSSSTTSILVGLVAGGMMPIRNAIPILMGANIGTTVTNTIVSLGSISRQNEFSKAMSGAILHDFFNLFAVLIFFPLEWATRFIERSAIFLSNTFGHIGGFAFISPLKAVVKPAADGILSLIQLCIKAPVWLVAMITLTVALALLFLALKNIVTLMKRLIIGRVEGLMHQYLFNSPARSFLLGALLTATVQSSSATTSIMVPIVGAGIISLNQIFPYVMGANIGTTITAILASLVTRSPAAVTVAFAHLCFNIAATLVFYPLRIIPIKGSEIFGRFMARQRMMSVFYIVLFFFLIPLLIIVLMKGGF
ncbi:MAG TPA: hypothetical protein ENN03_01620 [bacterium]|nr:hypothetical protein [bacterium]